ncbi:MAG: transporter substrate-binding domain-containing protein [Candidatus Delongbacteria bacterium]|jgi:polar amino acid transport system substrate-binding protein|nr:transporter substrate-binding domain-containing protein [Candidatus Delongbacteria bacterium]
MLKIKFICSLICILFIFAGCAKKVQKNVNDTANLMILTEEYAPLSFMENGKITGLSTEVVKELLNRIGTDNKIQMKTWEEGYKAVLTKPNVVLFSMAMTPERKDLLQWVGPIVSQDANLYAMKGSEIKINAIEQAKEVEKIATVTEYYTEQVMKKEGFANLESCATEEIAVKKLLNGEVQLFSSSNTTMPALLEKVGATMDDVENVLTMSTDLLYVAFSKGTSPDIIALWQKKLDEMKRDGTFRKIYKQWLPAENAPEILQLMTEEYPPITFMKDGKASGFVTDIVQEIIVRQDIPNNIRLITWKNAYNLTQYNPNVVLFSIERTPERENLFQWVGPVGKNSATFYAKKGSGIKINSLEDAQKIPAIATTTSWFTEQNLKSKGFTNLVSSPIPETSVKQLMNGEVQLSIFTDITVPEIVANSGYSMNDLEPVFTVSNTTFYIAISLGTPIEMVNKWQSVLDEVKADGTFEKIYRSYIPNADLNDILKK